MSQWPNLGAEHSRRTESHLRGSAERRSDAEVIAVGSYTHDVLIHDTDAELLTGTVAFVAQGLRARGTVLVHGTEDRVAMLRRVLERDPHLTYGFDRDLYRQPMRTLFNYEREVAATAATGEFWVTGTVPFHADPTADPAADAAWTRYESLVNEVLGPYPFHALCTYDTRELPAPTIAAARATHPCLSDGRRRTESPNYLDPAEFIDDPRAPAPRPPGSPPDATTTIHGTRDLPAARTHLSRTAAGAPELPKQRIEEFTVAVDEVLDNALKHGRPPITLSIWATRRTLTSLIDDQGPGIPNPAVGYRRSGHLTGLRLARRSCDELTIRNTDTGGCSVLITSGP